MASNNAAGYPIKSCHYCDGIWIDGAELETLFSIEKDAPSISSLKKYYRNHPDKSKHRICPICDELTLQIVKIHDVELDFCTECQGVFFDEGEIKKVLPNTYKSKSNNDLGYYACGEGLFWVLAGLFSGTGSC